MLDILVVWLSVIRLSVILYHSVLVANCPQYHSTQFSLQFSVSCPKGKAPWVPPDKLHTVGAWHISLLLNKPHISLRLNLGRHVHNVSAWHLNLSAWAFFYHSRLKTKRTHVVLLCLWQVAPQMTETNKIQLQCLKNCCILQLRVLLILPGATSLSQCRGRDILSWSVKVRLATSPLEGRWREIKDIKGRDIRSVIVERMERQQNHPCSTPQERQHGRLFLFFLFHLFFSLHN